MKPKIQTLLIIFIHFSISVAISKPQNVLYKGSSLSVESESNFLTSPHQTFTCGFYGLGKNAYWFAIWFTNSRDRTVVWMANRNRPINRHGSRIRLKNDGTMVLRDVDGSTIWETNTTFKNVEKAELLDSGNLVLRNPDGRIVWQSFDFPTDTLLPHQSFTKSKKLISVIGKGTFSGGYFIFFFDNNNVLSMMYDGPDISSLYWPNPDFNVYQNGRTNYNSSRIAYLDDMGRFYSSDQLQFNASDSGLGVKRRLTLDYDGNIRLYSLDNLTGLWLVSWESLSEQCRVHGICGKNGICVYTPQPKCSCPPGYEIVDPTNWNKGCKPKFSPFCSNSNQEVQFYQLVNTDFYGFDLNYTEHISIYTCRKFCLDDCRCEAFSYRLTGKGVCFTKSSLFNGYASPNFPGSLYLKLPVSIHTSELSILNGSNPICDPNGGQVMIESSSYDNGSKREKWVYLYWFVFVLGVIEFVFIVSAWWFLFRKHEESELEKDGYQAICTQFRRFTYNELKKATNNFKEELGRGASGIVYKGTLVDERKIAVKKLGDIYEGEELFWAEVSTIGKINHMNLVRMWGFCSEGKHKLLVYEYIENGSLDKHLFSAHLHTLGWKERFKIAVGTAKGLAYLHHECLEWVIHCDVKPENILLDSENESKIADFGLAKLAQRGSAGSKFSKIRGTKGYMAPEWALNLPVTAKVDVFSYGVVILELVKGIRLSNWVFQGNDNESVDNHAGELARFMKEVKGKIEAGESSWVDEVVDKRMEGKFSRNQAVKMVEIGISCLDEDRSKRPTMDFVVQALLECQDESTIHIDLSLEE